MDTEEIVKIAKALSDQNRVENYYQKRNYVHVTY